MSRVEVLGSRLVGALHRLSPDVTIEPLADYFQVTVDPIQLEAVALVLRDELGYSYLSMVTAVDWPDTIEIIYLTYSLEHPHGVYLKAKLPRVELPDSPTLTTVWPGAEFQEREVYDLMGINFTGHPDMRRILTEDDFPGHPLRKDFAIAPDYVLMRHLRYGAEGQFAPADQAAER